MPEYKDDEINEIGEIESVLKKAQKKSLQEDNVNTGIYIRCFFVIFMIIWTFVIAYNKFHTLPAWPLLTIPYGLFGLGIINSDEIADDEIEENVFSATFVTMGLIISLPLLTLINKEKENKELSHIIFLGMIFTLFSYFHIWVDKPERHICKIIRSCLETIAVDLYILALTIFFVLS